MIAGIWYFNNVIALDINVVLDRDVDYNVPTRFAVDVNKPSKQIRCREQAYITTRGLHVLSYIVVWWQEKNKKRVFVKNVQNRLEHSV